MKKSLIAAVAATGIFAFGNAMADGAALYAAKTCVACHGANGAAPIMPTYPKLAGNNAAYMVQQMKDIKSGARSNGQSAVMKGIMAMVSEAEMQEIADFLAAQK